MILLDLIGIWRRSTCRRQWYSVGICWFHPVTTNERVVIALPSVLQYFLRCSKDVLTMFWYLWKTKVSHALLSTSLSNMTLTTIVVHLKRLAPTNLAPMGRMGLTQALPYEHNRTSSPNCARDEWRICWVQRRCIHGYISSVCTFWCCCRSMYTEAASQRSYTAEQSTQFPTSHPIHSEDQRVYKHFRTLFVTKQLPVPCWWTSSSPAAENSSSRWWGAASLHTHQTGD